jgi:transcriptional regulator GlxA family with amidase domain
MLAASSLPRSTAAWAAFRGETMHTTARDAPMPGSLYEAGPLPWVATPTPSPTASPTSAGCVPFYIRRIERYLLARVREPVRLSELSALVGLCERSIQAGFRAHRGCSPMGFLRARRLELARQSLREAPRANVTMVALASGFPHLGRFSSAYRRQFGESPSETLRLARAAAPSQGR